ncbi:MAG: DUF4097 domain-containing protein [Eubacteriales bacterium]|nr:DUF4097 domain-containing protein [Eubacteriales bacterium]
MRAAGIIRIIVGLVLAVLLTAILVVLLTGQNIFGRLGWNGGWINNLIDRAVYTSGGMNEDTNEIIASEQASVPADSIRKIKIDWVAGNVEIRLGTGSEITFSESSYRNLTERQKMRYSVSSEGTLKINFCEDLDNVFDWFSVDSNMPAKTLVMEIPSSLLGQLTNLEIDTVSAEIDLSGVYGTETDLETVSGGINCTDIAADRLDISSTSGSIVCENAKAQKLDLGNISGSIRAEGEFVEIDAETVSGSMRLGCATVPSKIDADGVSGSVTVALPESAGFTARLDTVSGSFTCEFPGTMGSDLVVVGDGSANYRFNTVSGSLQIEKN